MKTLNRINQKKSTPETKKKVPQEAREKNDTLPIEGKRIQ